MRHLVSLKISKRFAKTIQHFNYSLVQDRFRITLINPSFLKHIQVLNIEKLYN